MKTILCCIILSNIFIKCFAVDYYSQGSVDPNTLMNWNVNPGGGGSIPGSFTNTGDKFIIQSGHTMTTTATWTIGSASSALQIQNGGTLQGNHLIILTGTFQIDNGAVYIHNNTGSVAETAGSSIFSGTELFAATSNFEIRRWPGKNAGLPNESPISWGNLIVNLQSDISDDGLPWNWNISDGSTLTIKGNLDIRATFAGLTFPSELRLTSSGIQTINVEGNFLMSGNKTKISIKSDPSQLLNGYTTMQVNGDISLTGIGQLELGVNTTFPNPYGLYELRFKGNFFSNSAAGVLYSSSKSASLVANGTSSQTFFHLWNLGCNLRIAPGATLNLAGALTLYGSDQTLAVSGTLNQNGYNLKVNGKIEIAGGIFNSSGNLAIGVSCTACSNLNGIHNTAGNTWCTATGTKGRINFTGSTISLEPVDSASLLTAGNSFITSPGDIYFVSSTASSLTELPYIAAYNVHDNSIFSLDATSYVAGDASMYQGMGGILRIGSADGITGAGNTTAGNVRTGLSKDYNFSGANSFEYFGIGPQVTGNGLPAAIAGTLKINNTSGMGTSGVTLSQSTTVSGILDLSSGKLTTSLPALITLDNSGSVILPVWGASYVVGPMKKTGSASFSFPIGKGNNFAPLAITGTGAATDEYIAEYFMANPQVIIGSPFDNPPIDHISALEWWTVDRNAGTTSKKVTLEATAYTNEILLSDLRNLRWDGSAWMNEGNTAYSGVSAGQVTSDVVDNFFAAGTPTPFTFGSVTNAENPLAIRLISFDAVKLNSSKSSVTWELAAFCTSASKFEVQRAGANNSFTATGIVSGNETNRFYNYTDNNLKNGINYYRLKMTDENGKITYSRTVAVMNGINGLLLTSLIPTVVTTTTMLTIASSSRQKLDLIVTDMQGRVVQKQNHTIAAGNTNIQLLTDRLAAGAYQLFGVSVDGKTNMIRFIKQ